MIEWDEKNKKNSNIINKFWARDNSGGFKPLLFGMGATTLAFFPMRKALVGEGPTELLLLPKIFKEALGSEGLDFQIVHGLSNINPKGLPMLDDMSKGVCYIVDDDKSGRDMLSNIGKAGVPEKYLISVKDILEGAVTIEDLLDEAVWLDAVNQYIDMFGKDRGVTAQIRKAPVAGRIKALPEAIRDDKISFSYNILSAIEANPNLKILTVKSRAGAKKVGNRIRKLLEIEPSAPAPI